MGAIASPVNSTQFFAIPSIHKLLRAIPCNGIPIGNAIFYDSDSDKNKKRFLQLVINPDQTFSKNVIY